MELLLKPLRCLVKTFYRKPILSTVWTTELVTLFTDLNVCVIPSPVLARLDPSKPTFLTDWSSEGICWIIIQPVDNEESTKATTLLQKICEYYFELTKDGARLKPVDFGSRGCNDNEQKFRSFVGEATCVRWAISQNRKYLWGNHVFWMCDCSAMKEILEYDSNIPIICGWAQELLAYSVSVLYGPCRMMIDVDSLTC